MLGRTLAKADLGAPTALGFRFGIAALVLLGVLALRRMPLLPEPGERLRALLLGVIGYAVEATLFFMGLERGTAAAVALLFYAYPSMVTLAEIALGWAAPSRRALGALALSAAGTVLVVSAGGRVEITPAGAALALGSAASFTLYLLAGSRLMRRTSSLTTAAWVAAGAATSLAVRGMVSGTLRDPSGWWFHLVANGIATGAAFTLMFAALRRLGPTRTSVVMTLEAFFAIVLAAVFLDETITAVQLLGGAAILAATAIIGLSRTTPVES